MTEATHIGPNGRQRTNQRPAVEAIKFHTAQRHAADPARLARAVRTVRAALATGAVALAELTPLHGPDRATRPVAASPDVPAEGARVAEASG